MYTIYNVISFAATTSDGVVAVFGNRATDPTRAVQAETISTILCLTPAFLRVGCILGFFKDHIHGIRAPGPDQVISDIFGSKKTLGNLPFKDSACASKMSQFCWIILLSNLPPGWCVVIRKILSSSSFSSLNLGINRPSLSSWKALTKAF